MTALSLTEASKLAVANGETKRGAIINLYAENSDIMNAMKFDGIQGNAYAWDQEGGLPSTAFRGVNEGYTASAGSFNPQKIALMIGGGDLDVDNFIMKTQGDNVRSRHEALKVKSLAQNITDTVVNGDNTSEPREFDGLQTLCIGDQLIANGATSGGDVLSLAKLDELIDSVANPTHLIMSRAVKRAFIQASRTSTSGVGVNLLVERDELGRPFQTYSDLPILTGYPKNKNTAILPYSEANPGGGSAVGTSIYCVNFGEDGVMGITNGGLQVRDLGELDTAPVWRTRIEWFLSMVMLSPYSAARLWGIKTGAFAA